MDLLVIAYCWWKEAIQRPTGHHPDLPAYLLPYLLSHFHTSCPCIVTWTSLFFVPGSGWSKPVDFMFVTSYASSLHLHRQILPSGGHAGSFSLLAPFPLLLWAPVPPLTHTFSAPNKMSPNINKCPQWVRITESLRVENHCFMISPCTAIVELSTANSLYLCLALYLACSRWTENMNSNVQKSEDWELKTRLGSTLVSNTYQCWSDSGKFFDLPQYQCLHYKWVIMAWSLCYRLNGATIPKVLCTVWGGEKICMCSVAQLCPNLCDPLNCSLPVPSVHRIFQARELDQGCHFLLQGIFLTQGSKPCLLCLLHCRQILYHWAIGEAHGEKILTKKERKY